MRGPKITVLLTLVVLVAFIATTGAEARGRNYRINAVEFDADVEIGDRVRPSIPAVPMVRVGASSFFNECPGTISVTENTKVVGSLSGIPNCTINVSSNKKLEFRNAVLDFDASLIINGGKIRIENSEFFAGSDIMIDASAELKIHNTDLLALSGMLYLDADGETKIDYVDLSGMSTSISSGAKTDIKDADVIGTSSLSIDSGGETKIDYVLLDGGVVAICASGKTSVKVTDVFSAGSLTIDSNMDTELDEVLTSGGTTIICADGKTDVKKSVIESTESVLIDASDDTKVEENDFVAGSLLIDSSGNTEAKKNDFTGVPSGMVTITADDECRSDDNTPHVPCT